MKNEPEALRLAAALNSESERVSAGVKYSTARQSSKELVRLHEVNQVMLNALKWIADQTYDPWTNGAEAQRHALNAIAKATNI